MSTSCDQALEQYVQLQSESLDDPYPLFQQLRAEDPVYWSEQVDAWVLTGYPVAAAILRDPHVSSNRHADARTQLPEAAREQARALREHLSLMMGNSDPPSHTRLRSLVNKAFTPRVVEAMSSRIQTLADQLLDAVQGAARMDVIRDFAYPLPIIVISELLGIPAEDRIQFKLWSDDFIGFIAAGRPSVERAQQAQQSLLAMADYFRAIAVRRRRHPQNDLISGLIAVEDHGQRLSEGELLAMCNSLLAGGHETTTNLFGNGLLALLRHPDQLRELRQTPALIVGAVEELLRYDSPVQRLERFATQDLELGRHRIHAGQRLWPMLGAANRDPAQFPDPDRLDLRRQPNPHLAFAHGIHFCVGAPLARLEGQIGFATLLRRFQKLELADGVVRWRAILAHRGLESLPVAV
jgi:cytochrome P450